MITTLTFPFFPVRWQLHQWHGIYYRSEFVNFIHCCYFVQSELKISDFVLLVTYSGVVLCAGWRLECFQVCLFTSLPLLQIQNSRSVLWPLVTYRNELLRAMDLRLNALREELTTAFDQATGSRYSLEEMTDVEKFSRHLGSTDLRYT